MTDQAKALLSAVSHATSVSPINEADLHKASGIKSIEEFKNLCELLYQSRQINRCLQTKAGVTQYLFWPTAIINKQPILQPIVNRQKMLRARADKEKTLMSKTPIASNKTEVNIMKNQYKKTNSTTGAKYPALLIVKTAAEHPNIKFDDLVALLIGQNKDDYQKARDMVYYCVQSKLLTKDSSKQLTLGTNDAWLIKNGFFDSSSSGVRVGDGHTSNFLKMPNIESDVLATEKQLSQHASPQTTTETLGDHLKNDPAIESIIENQDAAMHTPNLDVTQCVNLLFNLLPNNVGLGITKLADGNIHVNVAMDGKTYHPKPDEVESCINAIKTLTQFEAA